MKHTPGPWILDGETFEDNDGAETIMVFGPEGHGFGRVAMAYAECGFSSALLPNAQVIAAAPELLEACINLVNIINELDLDGFDTKGESIEDWTAEANSAITKAKVNNA